MMKNSFGTKVKVEELDVGGNLLSRLHEEQSTDFVQEPDNTEDANIVSYLGMKMCEEAGVDLILSAYAADPIVENGTSWD